MNISGYDLERAARIIADAINNLAGAQHRIADAMASNKQGGTNV